MDHNDIITQLKSIYPNPDYTRRSRREILVSRIASKRGISFRQVVFRFLGEGSAMVLAGALLLFLVTGFSAWNFLSPFELKSLDPVSLRAEAQAIDIQIQLSNLTYPEVLRNETTTVSTALPRVTPLLVNPEHVTDQSLSSPSSSAEGKPLTIDEALDRLTE